MYIEKRPKLLFTCKPTVLILLTMKKNIETDKSTKLKHI